MDAANITHAGTVEVLRQRIYDSPDHDPREFVVCVSPGTYQVGRDDAGTYYLELNGELVGLAPKFEDLPSPGMFTMTTGPHFTGQTVPVTKTFSAEGMADLVAHDVAQEGHPDQRLRFNLTPSV